MFKKKGFTPPFLPRNISDRERAGFTLIELMVVIAIIAVLAAVVAPQVFRQVEKGRVATVEGFYNNVKVAATSYFSDTGAWPPTCLNSCNTMANGFVTGGAVNWDGPYLDRWPADGSNPWGGNYGWNNAGVNRWITVANVPALAAAKLDRDIDGGDGALLGRVVYPGAAPVTVTMIVSTN